MKIACQLAPGELEQKEGACRHCIDAAVHNTSSCIVNYGSWYHDMIVKSLIVDIFEINT